MKRPRSAILGVLACLCVPAVSNANSQVAELITLHTPATATAFSIARGGRVGAGFCVDGQLRVWALPDARLLSTIQVSTNDFLFSTFSRDGSRLLTAMWNGDVVVWDAAKGTSLFQTRLPKYASAAAFSPDNRHLAVATGFSRVKVLELGEGGRSLELDAVAGGTQAVAFSPDGTLIATADSDTRVRIYQFLSDQRVTSREEFLMVPLTVDFTSDSKQVVAAGADKVAAFFDVRTGKITNRLKKQRDPVGYVEVSSDGKWLATVLMNATSVSLPAPLLIWETVSNRKLREWLPPAGIVGATWTADGQFLAATLSPQAVHIWQVNP